MYTSSSPLLGSINPHKIFASVDFPEPFFPIIPIDFSPKERVKFSKNEIQDLRKIKDLYLIARLVVFQDPLFAKFFPDEAVFDSRLNKPYSQNGQFFLDPSSEKVQNYGPVQDMMCSFAISDILSKNTIFRAIPKTIFPKNTMNSFANLKVDKTTIIYDYFEDDETNIFLEKQSPKK